MRVSNTMGVRLHNARTIIHEIELRREVTNAEIAQKHALSVATVSNIVNILKKSRMVLDAGSRASTGGRKPTQIALNPDYQHFVGLNISKHVVQAALLRFDGSIATLRFVYREFDQSDEYWAFLSDFCQKIVADAKCPACVGIGVPGSVEHDNLRITGTGTLGWDNVDFSGLLKRFDNQIAISDSARLAGLAQLYGKEGYANSVYLLLSRRIGGTLIVDNDISVLSQSDCNFGSMILSMGHEPNQVNGTFSEYCSASRIIDTLRSWGSDFGYVDFFRELDAGNAEFGAMWDDYMTHLAVAVYNIRAIFGMDIVVGGEMAEFLRPYFHELCSRIRSLDESGQPETYLHFSEYGQYDDAIGAALLARSQYLDRGLPAVLKDEE